MLYVQIWELEKPMEETGQEEDDLESEQEQNQHM